MFVSSTRGGEALAELQGGWAGRRSHSKTFKDGGGGGREVGVGGVDGRERRGKGAWSERGSGWPSAVQHQGLVRVLVRPGRGRLWKREKSHGGNTGLCWVVKEGVLGGNGCASPQEPAPGPTGGYWAMQKVCLCPRLLPLRLQASGVSGLEERVHGEGDAQKIAFVTDELRY